MVNSRRFIKFAVCFGVVAFACGITGCKGRTMNNMEPTGDTVEVVILQDAQLNPNSNEASDEATNDVTMAVGEIEND